MISRLIAIREAGSAVIYYQCDISNSDEWSKVRDQILGSNLVVAGVIHAAGILEDQRFENKTFESFARVYSSKVLGMKHLGEFAGKVGASVFCVFTSVSGTFGNIGQCDYAAANSAMVNLLNGFFLNFPQMRSFAISWGAWDQVGMAARTGVADILKSSGAGVLSPNEGCRLFREELLFGAETGEIVLRKVRVDGTAKDEGSERITQNKFCFLKEIISHISGNHIVARTLLDWNRIAWLRDHSALGVAILPATFGIEMMVQTALLLLPEYQFLGLEGFKIFREIRIPENKEVELILTAQASYGQGVLDRNVWVKIESTTEEVRSIYFEACIHVGELRENLDPSGEALADRRFLKTISPVDNVDSLRLRSNIYGNATSQISLGPFFHVLTDIQFMSAEESQGSGCLHEANDVAYYSDPFSREAGFHLASLMRRYAGDEILVPHSIGSIRNYHPGEIAQINKHDDGSLNSFEVRAYYLSNQRFNVFIFSKRIPTLVTEILDLKMVDYRSLLQ